MDDKENLHLANPRELGHCYADIQDLTQLFRMWKEEMTWVRTRSNVSNNFKTIRIRIFFDEGDHSPFVHPWGDL